MRHENRQLYISKVLPSCLLTVTLPLTVTILPQVQKTHNFIDVVERKGERGHFWPIFDLQNENSTDTQLNPSSTGKVVRSISMRIFKIIFHLSWLHQ